MLGDLFQCSRPGLLVSVRNAADAIAALEGGSDVIDVKEPTRGSLGPADAEVIQAVVGEVNGVRPVTVAMGDLLELQRDFRAMAIQPIPEGVIAFKIGLAGCATHPHWQTTWEDAIGRLAENDQPTSPHPVGVVYADWRAAAAPNPSEVLNAAVELKCAAILVDTWDKSSGALFEHWPAADLRKFIEGAQRRGMRVVLAGSLSDADAPIAAGLAPDLVAVRTAACEGGRNGSVSSSRVRHLKALLHATALPTNGTSRGRCQDMNSNAT